MAFRHTLAVYPVYQSLLGCLSDAIFRQERQPASGNRYPRNTHSDLATLVFVAQVFTLQVAWRDPGSA